MLIFLRHFLLLILTGVAVAAVEFPGTWSNGESEFKTVSIMLRADGQAVFATAVIPTYALWKKTDAGLDLTIAGGGTSLTLPFTYDSATQTLTGTLHDTKLVLRKVSDQQPPDMLARSKAKQEEDNARWKKQFRMEDRTLSNAKAVRSLVHDWLAAPVGGNAEDIFLSIPGSQYQLTLRGLGGNIRFIEIPLESRQAAKLSGYPAESKLLPGDAQSDLPLVFELPAKIRPQLDAIGHRPGVKAETHAFTQVTAFATEGFYRSVEFIVPAHGEPDAEALIAEILSVLWPDHKGKYTATLHFRVPDNR